MTDIGFFINSIMLGIGLAMDAFSVSMANGLGEPDMSKGKMTAVAGTYALFQAVMPMTGWFCVHTIIHIFRSLEPFIPWTAMILLSYVGGKMVYEGIRDSGSEQVETHRLQAGELLMQGVATSIDALSVGFTIAEYEAVPALVSAGIIGGVTFFICFGGILLGKALGMKLAGKASVFGGVILIAIGLEILIKSFL